MEKIFDFKLVTKIGGGGNRDKEKIKAVKQQRQKC